MIACLLDCLVLFLLCVVLVACLLDFLFDLWCVLLLCCVCFVMSLFGLMCVCLHV